MNLLLYVLAVVSVLTHPGFVFANNKSEFIKICEKPNHEQLITVKQIAANVSLKYKPTVCENIYRKIQKKKSFFDSGDYLLTMSPLYFVDNLEKIYISFDRNVTQINFSETKYQI